MKNLAGPKYKILERKSSKFGVVGVTDVRDELAKMWVGKPISYYDNMKRKDIYRTCLDKFVHDQLARPIVNLIVNATFSEPPDFQGDDKLVERADEIVRDSSIDWTTWGSDLEVHGDLFIRSFLGEGALIASIPPESIDVEYGENNVLDVRQYLQYKDEGGDHTRSISAEEMTHLKVNNTTNMVYGSSILRAILWWLDVLDNLWERNWIRGGQYYGAPIVVITGVPGEHQADVKTSLEADGQRPGRNWVFPEDVKVDTLDFTRNYPIQDLIDRVYQYILAACNIPQHMIYESDSSRGVAMFSGDAFQMMIKGRQHTWGLGLLRALRIIFEDEGLWKDDSKFRISWAPVFMRDLKNLADLVKVGMENRLLSKQTGREIIGVDHSEELDRFEQQEIDEPEPEPEVKVPGVSPKVAPAAKTPQGK